MGEIRITIKSKLHPSDSQPWQDTATIDDFDAWKLGHVVAKLLKKTMFAAWGCDGAQYFPDVEALFEYIPGSELEAADILQNIAREMESEARSQRGNTALNEGKTDELWAKSEPRYYASLVTPGYKGWQDVEFHLFHTEMSEAEMSELVVLAPNRTIEDVSKWYTGTAIEQTFSRAEVLQLYDYFKVNYEGDCLKLKRAHAPGNHCMGYGAYAVGGGDDFYMFDHVENYSLPFKVWGYFNLRDCERVGEAVAE